MIASTEQDLKVRLLIADDFDAIVQLDSKLRGGEDRREFWEKKFAIFRLRHPNLSLVATLNDHLIGYAMGNISGWEFGVRAGIGWVELIGVDPESRRHHVAQQLVEELLQQFKTLKVDTVYTMFTATNDEMRGFFNAMGFREGQLVHFQISLE